MSVSLLSSEQLTMSGFLLKHLILFTPDFYVGQKAPAQFVTNLRSGNGRVRSNCCTIT